MKDDQTLDSYGTYIVYIFLYVMMVVFIWSTLCMHYKLINSRKLDLINVLYDYVNLLCYNCWCSRVLVYCYDILI